MYPNIIKYDNYIHSINKHMKYNNTDDTEYNSKQKYKKFKTKRIKTARSENTFNWTDIY